MPFGHRIEDQPAWLREGLQQGKWPTYRAIEMFCQQCRQNYKASPTEVDYWKGCRECREKTKQNQEQPS